MYQNKFDDGWRWPSECGFIPKCQVSCLISAFPATLPKTKSQYFLYVNAPLFFYIFIPSYIS